MVFGDSNAYRPMNGRHCWPAMLQRISGGSLRVINESHDGRTTQFDSGKRNGLAVIASTLNHRWSVDWVLLALGTNDLKTKYGPLDAGNALDGVRQLIDLIVTAGDGARPVLLTPPPMGNSINNDLKGASERLPAMTQVYRQLAAKRRIPLIDIQPAINVTDDLEKDGVHLNARGRRKVAEKVWRNFAENLMPAGKDGKMDTDRRRRSAR
jgi:lysophospholipase L1-like esterase